MGVLRYDAADWVRFQTLAAALANTSDGAWTAACLFKQAVDSGFQAYSYLCAAGPVTKAGFSRNSGGALLSDVAAYGSAGQTIVGTTDTFIGVARKGAGAAPITYSRFIKSAGTWAAEISGTNLGDQVASTMLEIGTWQGGSDLVNAWVGLVAFWEGAMAQVNVEHLDDNWRTSDWYSNPHGAPTALIQGNVDALSLVDIMGNATNLKTDSPLPTLDPAETLTGWTFDGSGGGPSSILLPQSVLGLGRGVG